MRHESASTIPIFDKNDRGSQSRFTQKFEVFAQRTFREVNLERLFAEDLGPRWQIHYFCWHHLFLRLKRLVPIEHCRSGVSAAHSEDRRQMRKCKTFSSAACHCPSDIPREVTRKAHGAQSQREAHIPENASKRRSPRAHVTAFEGPLSGSGSDRSGSGVRTGDWQLPGSGIPVTAFRR
jgi:hypothetical protein